MKGFKGTVVAAILLITFLLTGCVKSSDVAKVTGDDLIKPKNNNLIVQGNVETKEININCKVPGKLSQVKVAEGSQVKKGQVLAIMESENLTAKKQQVKALIEAAKGAVSAANAAKAAAESQSNKAEAGVRPQQIAQAKAAYDYADKMYTRVKTLVDAGVASQSQLDEVEQKREQAKQMYDTLMQGTRVEDKALAQAMVSIAESAGETAKGKMLEAEAGLKEVDSYIKDTVIKAPTDGVVTTLNVEAGELVSTGMPILVISKLNEQWIEVNVKETDLPMVKLNGIVTVKMPAFGKEQFKGKVVRINEKPDFATKRSTNDNGQYDVLSFGVKVQLINCKKTLHPGMTALVDFGKRVDK